MLVKAVIIPSFRPGGKELLGRRELVLEISVFTEFEGIYLSWQMYMHHTCLSFSFLASSFLPHRLLPHTNKYIFSFKYLSLI